MAVGALGHNQHGAWNEQRPKLGIRQLGGSSPDLKQKKLVFLLFFLSLAWDLRDQIMIGGEMLATATSLLAWCERDGSRTKVVVGQRLNPDGQKSRKVCFRYGTGKCLAS